MRVFRRGVPAVLVVLLSVLFLKGSTINVPTGTWQSAASMSVARANAVAVLVPDGRIVLAGGADATGAPTAAAEAFSADGTFSALPAMSVARARHAAIYTMTGDLLVTGGVTSGGGFDNSAEVFDSLTNTWHSLSATMVDARAGHTMSQLQNGNVLIAGGENSSGPVAALEIYDITSGQFSFAGTLTTARRGHAAAVLNDGRVLIIGGTTVQSDGTAATLASTEIYDPSTGQVTAGPSLSTPRTNATATTLLDGRVLVVGGSYPEGANGAAPELASAEIYDPVSNTFTASASHLTTARTGHLAFLLPNNNNVLIAGGTSTQPDGTVSPLASAELYPPWTDTFAPTSSMSTARDAATGSPLSNGTYIGLDGMLLIAGGTNQNSAEVYGFATVKTDKTDYMPGDVVTITGHGWQPGETVTLTLLESPNVDTHPPMTAVADANGNFTNTDFSPDQHDLTIQFFLTASGTQLQAQTTFSDGSVTGAPIGTFIFSSGCTNTSSSTFTAGTTVCAKAGPATVSSGSGNLHIQWIDPSNTVVRDTTLSATNGQTVADTFVPPVAGGWTVNSCKGGADFIACTGGNNLGSTQITVNPGAVAKLQILAPGETAAPGTTTGKTGTPTAQTAGSSFNATVNAVDANWNRVTSVNDVVHITSTDANAVLPSDTALSGGTASLVVTLKTRPSQTLTVSDVTNTGTTSSTSASIPVNAATPNKLAFIQQPTTTVAGVSISPAITVRIQDQFGNLTTSTANVTLAFANNAGGAGTTLNGTTTVVAVSGTATFSNINITKAATGYTLAASSAGLTGITSSAFDITPAAANKLAFAQNPTDTNANAAITPAVTVQVLDTFGNLVSTSTASVAIAIGNNPGSGTLSGTTPVNAINGVATFSNLSINKAGVGYTLLASSSGLTGATSSAFTIKDLSTTTTVVSSANPSTYGDSVTFTATVANNSSTPTGTVKFYDTGDCNTPGTLLSGPTTLVSGSAAFTTSSLSATSHAIVACYTPTGSFTASGGNVSQTVNKKTASVTPTAAGKTYGDNDPTLAGTLAGFLSSDNVTATYSRTAGETVAGSPYTISATLSPAAVLGNYSITYNTASFTISPKNASVTPNAASKTYGDGDPSFTGTLTGFLASDNVTATYTRTTGETVGGSPYTISATLSPAAVLGNYNISYNTANFTINRKDASITPVAASKTYGDPDPALTGTLAGFLAADNVTATYSRTAGETVAGGPYTISATLSPAAVLGNYNVTYNTASFTINKRNASVTPNAASKTYGDADPVFTGTLSNFLAADDVTATYSRTAGETVAGSPYTVSATLSPAAVLGNYNVTYNTASFTINKRNASVTPNAANKTYGDADPAFTGTLSNFVTGDNVTATYTRTAGETVAGSPYTISANLSPVAVLSNYNVTYNTASFTINPRPASVTPAAAGKVYGDADPALTGTLSGFLAADGVIATYSRTAGETVAGSPYTISATLSPAGALGNYSVTYNTAAFTITPKPASVTPTATSKVYGDADPAFTGTLSGFLAADGVTAIYSRTAGETVGGSPYTISAVLSPAGALTNYNITYNTASFTITPRPASVTPAAAGKTYGDPDPTLTGTLSGFVPSDNVTATYSRAAGESVAGSPYTISATLSPAAVLVNYTITYNTAIFTITPKPASVTPTAASKTYGDPDPALTGTLSGFVPADNVTATYSRTAGETVAASPYTISATLSPAAVLGNYTITYNTAQFTINKRIASVTPNAASKTYGDADPALTGTLAGFVAGDNVTATYSRTAGETVAGSPYTISATLSPAAVLGNYTITYNTASFTINPKSASVTPNAASKTYGDNDPAFTGTLSGFLAGDNVTATYSRSAGETVAGSPYTISATLSPAGVLTNYSITYNTAPFTINRAQLTVTVDNKSMLLNGVVPTLSGTITGIKYGDPITATYSTTANGTVVGTFTITAALNDPSGKLSNYNLTINNGTLTVSYASGGICDGDYGHQILQPISAGGTSVFKQGSTTPAKFRVCDSNGVSIGTPGVVTSFNIVQIITGTVTDVDQIVDSTTPDTAFRWDPTGQQWIFNISTKSMSKNATYVFLIVLNDGSKIYFQYGLR